MATVSDYLLERLRDWGVERIFGYPGDGINGIMGALNRAEGKPRFVQTRHEEMAAFMACAHAKFTGEVGVCLATSGPGAIHLLNGLYDAKMDHQPVVAIVGQSARGSMGSNYQQEVDLPSLFKDVAGEFVQTAMTAAQVRQLIDRAFRVAKSQRTVTCLIVPKDLQDEPEVRSPPRRHGSVFTSVGVSTPRVLPNDADLRKAAEILNAGAKVALLVGAGALGAAEEVMAVAEVLGAGVAKALLGKAVVADALPYVTGGIGLLGTKPSDELMSNCDTLLMVGTGFPYAEFLPKEGQARAVQIDLDGRKVGDRYPTELNLIGDSTETLRALLPLLTRKEDRAWRQGIEAGVKAWWELLDKQAHQSANPINPELVFWELSPRLPDRCILTADSGTVANWFGRELKIRPGMQASLSGNLASMGAGVPYAVGAKFAHPDRPVICFMGDGAMQMNGTAELLTIAKYWREWSDPRLIVMVLNNADLNMVTWEMRVMEGDPKYAASQDLPKFSYGNYAESIGLVGMTVDRPEDVGPAWDRALASDRPVVLDIHTDPDVATLPPHITFEEARNFLTSMMGGDPNAAGVIAKSVKAMAATLLPGGKPRGDR